ISRTSSGIGISRCDDTSCSIRGIGKSGARSPGPTGLPVPGCNTAAGGFGMSAMMLYQVFGISESLRRNFTFIASSPIGLDSRSFSHIPANRVSGILAPGQGLPDQEEPRSGLVKPPNLVRPRDTALHDRVRPGGEEGEQALPGGEVHAQGGQVPVVDPDQARPGTGGDRDL